MLADGKQRLMPPTLLQLKTDIRADIWADSEAENLVAAHDNAFLEALSVIQDEVPCYRDNQANVVDFSDTFFKMGMTVLAKPAGVVDYVYTIAEEDWDDPVFYRPATLKEVQCYRADCREYTTPEVSVGTQLGFRPATDENDVEQGRARYGLFCIHQGNIYMAPWIQSNEQVVIEWNGKKAASAWEDADPVSDEIDFRKAVKLYVQYAHERDYGDAARARLLHEPRTNGGAFDEALSDLMRRCHSESDVPTDKICGKTPTWAQLADDSISADDTLNPTHVNIVGDDGVRYHVRIVIVDGVPTLEVQSA